MGLLLYCFQIGLIKKDIHYLLSECFRIKGNKISVFCVYAYRFCFNYCFDVICWAATNTAIRLNTVFFYSSSSVYGFSPSPQCSMISRGTSEAFCYFSFFLIRIVVRLYIFICVAIMRRHTWIFFFCSTQCAANEFTAIEQFYLAIELKCQRRRWTQIEYCPNR